MTDWSRAGGKHDASFRFDMPNQRGIAQGGEANDIHLVRKVGFIDRRQNTQFVVERQVAPHQS